MSEPTTNERPFTLNNERQKTDKKPFSFDDLSHGLKSIVLFVIAASITIVLDVGTELDVWLLTLKSVRLIGSLTAASLTLLGFALLFKENCDG